MLGRRLRAAFFVYLAVERRVARASLATVFWAERDEEQARHALRQSWEDADPELQPIVEHARERIALITDARRRQPACSPPEA